MSVSKVTIVRVEQENSAKFEKVLSLLGTFLLGVFLGASFVLLRHPNFSLPFLAPSINRGLAAVASSDLINETPEAVAATASPNETFLCRQ